MANSHLERVLVEIDALPPISGVFRKVLELTRDESSSRQDLIRCISLDQAIAAKTLQTVNSAYLGVGRKVSSLEVAVGLLGDEQIREIAIMCAASGVLRKSIVGYGVMADEFWFHSVATAFASKIISEKIGGGDHETAFAAGLLHDIGKLALDVLIKQSGVELFWDKEKDFLPGYHFSENQRFGFNHCTAGFFLAKKWELPANLMEAIAFHHSMDLKSDYQELIQVVNFGDILAHFIRMKITNPDFIGLLLEEHQIPFGFSPQIIEDIYTELKFEIDDARSFLED